MPALGALQLPTPMSSVPLLPPAVQLRLIELVEMLAFQLTSVAPAGLVMVSEQLVALQEMLTRIASSTASRPVPLALKLTLKGLADAGLMPLPCITLLRLALTTLAASSTWVAVSCLPDQPAARSASGLLPLACSRARVVIGFTLATPAAWA